MKLKNMYGNAGKGAKTKWSRVEPNDGAAKHDNKSCAIARAAVVKVHRVCIDLELAPTARFFPSLSNAVPWVLRRAAVASEYRDIERFGYPRVAKASS